MNEEEESLDQLLKSHKISQRTFDRAKVAKEYIEHKYNLKSIINTKWNNIIDKIKAMNINEKVKIKIINEINKENTKKIRKNREKQTIRDYESLSIIGRGAFGEVHVCREKKTGNIYAIKKIKKETLIQKNQVIHIRNEQLIMSKVKSPWIVDLKASFQEDDYLYLVMEFLPGGDFMSLLIKKDILTEKEARFYTAELILAVDSIHKLDCIHRDIKPDNILIGKDGHIKLSDFGLARVSDKLFENNKDENFEKNKLTHQKNYSCVGTAYYVAPEVLNKSGYGMDIDWWSVGVIFFEMLVGYAPFCSEETKDVCYKVLNWEKYLKIPDEITLSREAEDLINKMINYSDKRLGKNGIEEIKVHPFFKGVDWDNIRKTKAPFIPNLKNDCDTKYFEHFDVEEPFYPPKKRFKKRKDIEFLGYTYKDGNDLYEINYEEINETYNEILKKYNINDNMLKHSQGSSDSTNTKEDNLKNTSNISVNRNKNLILNTNKNNISMTNNPSKVKIGSNRTKGNSPPLYSKINLNKSKVTNTRAQKPLKTIKIADKKNTKLNTTEAKSANNSKNKISKMKLNNNMKNKIKLQFGDNKKLDTSMNNSSKSLVGGKSNNLNKKLISYSLSSSIKKITSAKNVNNNNNNTSLNRTIEGESQTKKNMKLQKNNK